MANFTKHLTVGVAASGGHLGDGQSYFRCSKGCILISAPTSIDVAQLPQRDRAAWWVSYGQKLEYWNWKTIFTDIIGLYSTTLMHLASKAIEFSEKRKIRAITPFKVIEVGTNRKPVCDFILVISSK